MQPLAYYFHADYLFNLQPHPLGQAGRKLLPLVVIASLATAMVLRWLAWATIDPIRRAGLRHLARPLAVMGVLAALYTGVAWLGTPILSIRLALLVGSVAGIWWVAAVARREWKTQPQKRAVRERRLLKKKYLPK